MDIYFMCFFDKLRERNRAIGAIVRFQNSVWYPLLFALICVVSATCGKAVYIPCIAVLCLSAAFASLFGEDLKVLFVPAFLIYYSLGIDSELSYYNGEALFDVSSLFIIAPFALVMLACIVYRMVISGAASDMLKRRGLFWWGILSIDAVLLLNGAFSPDWKPQNLLYGALSAIGLTVFYLVFLSVLSHSKDAIAYACKVMVCMGYAVSAEILIIAYKVHLQGNLIKNGMLDREMLSLSWGIATIIGGVIALAIPAALYLARTRRYSGLSFASALLFWLVTVVIDCRSAIIFGGITLVTGIIICCVGGRNRVANRIYTAITAVAAVIAVTALVINVPDIDNALDAIMTFLRFSDDDGDILGIRRSLWENGIGDFLSAPLLGSGFSNGGYPEEMASPNLFSNMYHNIIIEFLGSMGIAGLLAFAIHIKHGLEVFIRRFSVERAMLFLIPLSILGMSLVDNFFFYFNFQIIYAAFLAIVEYDLEQKRRERIDNVKRARAGEKPRVAFTYVEAGKGHIVPTRTVCEAFRRKYGDRVEIIESKFFTETGNADMEKTEKLFSKAVKSQNRSPVNSILCRIGNFIAGDAFGIYVLLSRTISGRKTNPLAVKHVEELDADVIYSAHWAIPYYTMQSKKPHPYVICFCPDVYSNGMFNVDSNRFLIPSEVGYRKVMRQRMYAGGNVSRIPFPIRNEITELTKSGTADLKAAARERLGIEKDEFVVTLCDGGYGMARLEATVEELVKADTPMTLIALCGINHELYLKLDKLSHSCPEHIRLISVDFTDNVIDYIASADLFVGKSGANAIAEPVSLGVPIIVTKCITYIEKGIMDYHVRDLGLGLYIPSAKRAARKVEEFAKDSSLLDPYRERLALRSRENYDAEASADVIWEAVCEVSRAQKSESAALRS